MFNKQKKPTQNTQPSIHSQRLRPFFIENIIEGYENTVMGAHSYGTKDLELIHTSLIGEKDIVAKFELNFKPKDLEEEKEFKTIKEYLLPINALYNEIIISHQENLFDLYKDQLPKMMDYYKNNINQQFTRTGVHELAVNRHFIHLLIEALKTNEFNNTLKDLDKRYIEYFKANPKKLQIWEDVDTIESEIFDNSYWWWHLKKLNDLSERELSNI